MNNWKLLLLATMSMGLVACASAPSSVPSVTPKPSTEKETRPAKFALEKYHEDDDGR